MCHLLAAQGCVGEGGGEASIQRTDGLFPALVVSRVRVVSQQERCGSGGMGILSWRWQLVPGALGHNAGLHDMTTHPCAPAAAHPTRPAPAVTMDHQCELREDEYDSVTCS